MQPDILTFDLPDAGQPPSTYRLTCQQWGKDSAPRTVLCVHGLTRNARDFDFLAQALGGDARVLCPDMPGRGESPWLADPARYNYPAYVAGLAAMLDNLGVTQLDWVGTSMGGIIGMMMANARPGLIRALALNDIGAVVSAAGLKRIAATAAAPTSFATRAEAEAALRERCASFGIHDDAHWQHLFTHGIQLDGGGFRLAFDPAILAVLPKDKDIRDIELWNLWDAVAKIPLLLIRGAGSDVLSRETATAMQKKHPRLTLCEIAGAGHAPALMADSQTVLVAEWLAGLDA